MSGPNGGERPGAGRKPKAEKFAGPIAAAEQKIADRLPEILESLLKQALGLVVDDPIEEWIPAGLARIKAPFLKKNGDVWIDDKGKPLLVDARAFPHLEDDDEIRVKRRPARRLPPDFRATAYLIDRILSKVGQEPKEEAERLDIRAAIMEALASAARYQDPDEPGGGPTSDGGQ